MSVSASSPGVVFEDLFIIGSTVPETLPGSPGHIRAYDVHTGKLRWIFHTIPHPGEFGYETWPKDAYTLIGGANAWAGVTLDEKQPYPVKPPPFTRQNLTEEMLTTRTPAAHAAVVARFKRHDSGMFAPPTERGTIVFPGFDGGAEWGGAAFDPSTGLLYVNSNEMPWIVRLIPNNDTSLYNVNCASCHRADRTGTTTAPSLVDLGH